ncbi:MAG: sensor histidine kinase [Thaumarchaeota archaeon]|nr:sensor histidine kinase [Nitrososphaerota archaeon]MDE1872391.1 sensor histidine kinase [Nitrososphaerota archaeon]
MKFPITWNLKTALVVLFVVISITSVSILAVTSFEAAQNSLKERIDAQLQNEAKYRAELIKNIWNLKVEQLTLLSSTEAVRTFLNEPLSQNAKISPIAKAASGFLKGTDFYNLQVIDKNGRIVYATNSSLVGQDVSNDTGFKNGLQGSFYFLTKDQKTDKPAMIVAVPVFNDVENSSGVIGVIEGERGLALENNITTDRANLGSTGEIYLVNKDMYMITDSRFIQNAPFNVKVDTLPVRVCFQTGQDFSSAFIDHTHIPQELRTPIMGKGGVVYPDYRQIPVFGASHCERDAGFVLLAEMDESEIYSPITQLSTQYVAIGAVIVLAVGLVSFFVANSISKPIVKLANVAERISKGDLDARIEETKTINEVWKLSHSFKTMVFNLGELIRQVQDLNRQLRISNEELKIKDKMKDEFISIASHELKNPVQPILGFAYLAKKGKIPHEEAWDGVLEHARRLKRLATDVLDVSKIESGSLNYKMEKIRINQVVCEVADSLRVNLAKDVTMVTDLDGQEIEVLADRERIIQVLGNIIENAIKFTKHGTIKVSSKVHRDNNKVEITVTDTGGGISGDILPNLFGKFVTMSVKDGMEHGTGLGLFIAKKIIEAHKGEIRAYNNAEGATFVVTLPIDQAKTI